jgi:uncharacterized protein (DUF433 family)
MKWLGYFQCSSYNPSMHANDVVAVNPNIQGGTPCFKGTRVPVSSLFDHLEQGYTLNEFLADFPTVQREQAFAVLELAKADMPRHAQPAA